MKAVLAKELEELSKIKKTDVPEIISQAVKIGISRLWQEMILNRYLSKKISRKKAIKLTGIENVKLAEKQKQFVLEDIKWGVQHAS